MLYPIPSGVPLPPTAVLARALPTCRPYAYRRAARTELPSRVRLGTAYWLDAGQVWSADVYDDRTVGLVAPCPWADREVREAVGAA